VTDIMHEETALAMARVLGERNEGCMQIAIHTGADRNVDWHHVERLAEISRRPILWNGLMAQAATPQHRDSLNWLTSCKERGLRVYAHASTCEVTLSFTMEDFNLWDDSDAWCEATTGTVEEKLVKLADPARRQAIKDNPTRAGTTGPIENVVVLRVHTPEHKQFENLMIRDVCALTGKHPVDAVLDIAVADNLKTLFYSDRFNGLRARHREVVEYEYGLPGTSDGGAHTKFLTGGRYTTDFLTKWVRELAWVSLEDAHWRLSAYPAYVAGFQDRGILREGAAADIVIYDFANLEILPMEVAYDLPGDEWRRVQKAKGYRSVLVNGEVTIEDDKETGVASGRLLRHGVGKIGAGKSV
jgi:N-acyl-D-aspartate/D-glutamate deacylase